MSARSCWILMRSEKLRGQPVLEQVLGQLPGRKAWIMERVRSG
jgi:hypothetical protein